MRAVTITSKDHSPRVREVAEPSLPGSGHLLIKVLEVGVCGTDRAIVRGEGGEPPAGSDLLTLGHEMLGQVVQIDADVSGFEPGELVVCTVRRSCGQCEFCGHGASDMCSSGMYTERGIRRANGYDTELITESIDYCVRVPAELRPFAVLTEPLTVVEKAILESVTLQHRLDWVKATVGSPSPLSADWRFTKRALIAGAGPIGMMGAFLLRLRGIETHVIDIVDDDSYKAQLIASIGATYHDSRKGSAAELAGQIGNIDLIVEATGVAPVAWDLLDALGVNGVLVFTGVPGDRGGEFQMEGGHLMRQQVLRNQIVLGSVNANRSYFEMAVSDMQTMALRWPTQLAKVITGKHPLEQCGEILAAQAEGEVKAVFTIAS